MVDKPDGAICWCPACDEGWVKAVTIQPIGVSGRLCGECEAFWKDEQVIAEDQFTQLSALVREHGATLKNVHILEK